MGEVGQGSGAATGEQCGCIAMPGAGSASRLHASQRALAQGRAGGVPTCFPSSSRPPPAPHPPAPLGPSAAQMRRGSASGTCTCGRGGGWQGQFAERQPWECFVRQPWECACVVRQVRREGGGGANEAVPCHPAPTQLPVATQYCTCVDTSTHAAQRSTHGMAATQSAWRGALVSSATSPNTSPARRPFTARFSPCQGSVGAGCQGGPVS